MTTEDRDRPVRVLIVDDHEVLAASLAQYFDGQPGLLVVGIATTLAHARRFVATESPDVVLLDNRLPDGDGVAAVCELRALRRGLQVVMLTAAAEDHVVVAALEAGAVGIVSKSSGLEHLTRAVRAAAMGETVISPELLTRLTLQSHRAKSGPNDLTPREQEVLLLLAKGMSNAAIASRLTVSVSTVRNHVANLSGKLGAHSKLEALSIAIKKGLVVGR